MSWSRHSNHGKKQPRISTFCSAGCVKFTSTLKIHFLNTLLLRCEMHSGSPLFILVPVLVSLSHALLPSLSLMSKEMFTFILVHKGLVSWTRFFPEAALYVLFQPEIVQLSRIPSRQLLDWLQAVCQDHISLDQDLALEPNQQDRSCLTVLPLLPR